MKSLSPIADPRSSSDLKLLRQNCLNSFRIANLIPKLFDAARFYKTSEVIERLIHAIPILFILLILSDVNLVWHDRPMKPFPI